MYRISKERYKKILEKMLLIRRFEEKLSSLFSVGMLHGTTHLYIGEEAVAAGVCCALDEQDLIVSTHRCHGHCIAKGIDLNRMMAEIYGKVTGSCKGKGGSMHIADFEKGIMGGNGIVGGGIPLAVGAGLTAKLKNIDCVVACFFGDGATNQGAFHESLNLASIWKLPVLFVCENNKYGMSTNINEHMNIQDIAIRAESYGIPGINVDGMDAIAVYNETRKVVECVKKSGPMLLVCDTYRYYGHSKSDLNVYRTKDEIDFWKKKDAIKKLEKYLIENRIFTNNEMDSIEDITKQQIEDAVEYALACQYPSLDMIGEDVYVE